MGEVRLSNLFLTRLVNSTFTLNLNQDLLAFLTTAYRKILSRDVCRPIYHNRFTVET